MANQGWHLGVVQGEWCAASKTPECWDMKSTKLFMQVHAIQLRNPDRCSKAVWPICNTTIDTRCAGEARLQ